MKEFKLASSNYHDFSGLGELRARAQRDDPKAAQEVGQKFEALFIQMVLKSAREATETMKSGLMGSSAQDTFEEMYHKELSQEIARRGVFGVADWITENIEKQGNSARAIGTYEQSAAMPLEGSRGQKFIPMESEPKPMNIDKDSARTK